MNDDLTDLYQEVILEHAKSPRNFREIVIATRVTVEPVREHLEQVLWGRLEEFIEKG